LECDAPGLKHWFGVSAMAVRSLSPCGRGLGCAEPNDSKFSAVGPAIIIPRNLLRKMRRQRMIARLIEERRLFGGGFQKLLVLVVDIVAELNGLVFRHPCREINPGHRNLLRQMDILALAGGDGRVDRG